MATRLFNGPICQVRNWYVDVQNDGTMAGVAGEVPAPVNTHSAIPVHHSHHSYHTNHTHEVHRHRHHTPPLRHRPKVDIGPIKILIFDPKKVARFLNNIAVLKARRDKMVVVWETYDEIRDVNKKTIPEHSDFPGVRNIFRGTTTVETGDIYETLRTARKLAEGWAKEFTAQSAKGANEARAYLLQKVKEGEEHLKAMSRIYSRAAHLGVAERNLADGLERVVKTTKLVMDVGVSFIGLLLPQKDALGGFGVEMAYVLVSSDEFWAGAWGVSDPKLVGFQKVAGKDSKKAKEVGITGLKGALEWVAHIVEHTIGKSAKQILLQNEKLFEENLEALEKVVNAEATWFAKALAEKGVPTQYIGHLMEGGEMIAKRRVRRIIFKQATKGLRGFGHVLTAARWVVFADEVWDKYKEYEELWKEPMEGEERQGGEDGGGSSE